MPIYEYKCLQCGYCFEIFQKINETAPDACPQCGGPIQKIISAPAIHFKGNGWYVTDYARSSPSNSSQKDKSPEKKTADKPEGTPDTSAKKESPGS
jgi:putative FmdB family regulatory protein